MVRILKELILGLKLNLSKLLRSLNISILTYPTQLIIFFLLMLLFYPVLLFLISTRVNDFCSDVDFIMTSF